MHLPRFMRRVNRVFTNPIMGTFAWLVPPLAVVHHVGRKSGRAYRSPVVAFRSAEGFVIPMTYGRDVDWARNIVKAHGCEVEQMGRRLMLHNPRIVGFKGAEAHLPAIVRPALRAADFPGYVLLSLETEKPQRTGKPASASTSTRKR
jgi:deazaflavin-dependent oxidoreductase (nitroreductase family)